MSIRLRAAAVVVSILAAVVVVRADWTAVASTGTVDEADTKKVVLNNDGSATISSTINSTSAKLRFNVVDSASIEREPDPNVDTGPVVFAMRYRDNGQGARVIATLKRIFLGGFAPLEPAPPATVVATIDSDRFSASDDWQIAAAKAADCCTGDRGLTFLNFGYVVEVQLIKNNESGTPGVMGVQLFRDEP